MAISNQEAESTIAPFIAAYDHAFDNKQDEAVGNLYDPTSVLVQVGKGAIYGRDAIRAELKRFMDHMVPGTKTEASKKKYGGANGYIVYSAFFKMTLPTGETSSGDFEQLWKKGADGKYLIVYDHFTLG